MLSKLKQLLAVPSADGEDGEGEDSLRLAAAVLMVEAALMDEEFRDVERAKISELLARRFALTETEALGLVERGETRARQSVEIYGFTREIKDRFSESERGELMEMLWEIAYVDGELHDHEAQLMRRLAGLLYVSDRESGEARKRALERLSGSHR
jgi:uncharacterized tellurite resistance protein B-like protein